MTTTTAPTRPTTARIEHPARRLRQVLAVNAATSLVTGVAAVAAAPYWSETLGIAGVGWIRLVGVGLVVFGLDVAVLARRSTRLRAGALAVSIADLAWVAATLVALGTIDFTTTGTVLAVVIGVGVLDFALLQLWFRSQLA